MLGQSKPVNAYSPLEDRSIPLADVAAHFVPWVAAYNAPIVSVSEITISSMEQLKPHSTTDPKYTPSMARVTAEELAGVTCLSAAIRCPTPMFQEGMDEAYRSNLRHALFDTNGAWKQVRAVLLWPDMTVVYCFWAAKLITDELREAEKETDGTKVRRDVAVVKLEGANHFVSVDERSTIAIADRRPSAALRRPREIRPHSRGNHLLKWRCRIKVHDLRVELECNSTHYHRKNLIHISVLSLKCFSVLSGSWQLNARLTTAASRRRLIDRTDGQTSPAAITVDVSCHNQQCASHKTTIFPGAAVEVMNMSYGKYSRPHTVIASTWVTLFIWPS